MGARRLGRTWTAGALASVVAIGALAGVPTSASADEPTTAPAVSVVESPVVSGTPRFGSDLSATDGLWDPADVVVTRQWMRDGRPVAGRTGPTYRLDADDVDHDVSLVTTATAPTAPEGSETPAPAVVESAPVRVGPALIGLRAGPSISGKRRFGTTLKASPGTWTTSGLTFRYLWHRDGSPVDGATGRTYAIRPTDVGHRMSVQVTATRAHHETVVVTSSRTAEIAHRRDVRRTITYSVRRNGSTASLATFREQAAATLADARGWRGAGIRFREVSSGGTFTLVLAKASRVPSYSSGCSATYSCRVGRNVIINETRWNNATSMWRKADRSLRDYRHMVVNHEVGHLLGKGHARCSGKGRLAPVMQQQSKGLAGCKANPWPLVREL